MLKLLVVSCDSLSAVDHLDKVVTPVAKDYDCIFYKEDGVVFCPKSDRRFVFDDFIDHIINETEVESVRFICPAHRDGFTIASDVLWKLRVKPRSVA